MKIKADNVTVKSSLPTFNKLFQKFIPLWHFIRGMYIVGRSLLKVVLFLLFLFPGIWLFGIGLDRYIYRVQLTRLGENADINAWMVGFFTIVGIGILVVVINFIYETGKEGKI